jgi:hypothetical protein
MKRRLFILLAGTILLSCEGPMGPPGESGVETQWQHLYYQVEEHAWELMGDGQGAPNSYYQYVVDEPALTNFIYREGVVTGYLVANPGTPDEVLRPLPDTWPVADRQNYWSESVTFDYMPGSVAFYVGYSDFATNIRPGKMIFKLTMIW